MTRGTLSIVIFFFATLAFWLGTIPAQAQMRVFVTAQGSDSNPCTFAAPCRTFQHAHDTVLANGEIDVLDPAGYGALTITKSISIQGHGFSGITQATTGANAITINAGATDTINLRGLVIEGFGSGLNGIVFNTGASLNIQDCVIRNFLNAGIDFAATSSASIAVSDTIVSDNLNGILVIPGGSGMITIRAAFERVQAIGNNAEGFFVSGGTGLTGSVQATAADSVATDSANGFRVTSVVGGAIATFTLTNAKALNNAQGVVVYGTATMFLTGSTVSGNSNFGFFITSGGTIKSYGNNSIIDSTNNGALTPVGQQ